MPLATSAIECKSRICVAAVRRDREDLQCAVPARLLLRRRLLRGRRRPGIASLLVMAAFVAVALLPLAPRRPLAPLARATRAR